MVDDPHTVRRGRSGGRAIPSFRVEVVSGPDAGAAIAWEEDRPLTVGSSADNDLVLTDRTVSRYHLELEATTGGIRITDLGSLNGTFLGEARIERATLSNAELRVGDGRLAVSTADLVPSGASPHVEIAGMIAESEAMQRVAASVAALAPSGVSVLVQGETGTGKEVVARALHEHSDRADGPFVVVDCGSMPATLIASELFGHERGAFTGADRTHVGAFERADAGTVFLDEIGELPLAVQPALLGALERRSFRRVGGSREIDVDVRVVAATHRDLRAEVNADRFRADLYYRLAVARVILPPLRERPEDVEPLVRRFVREVTGDTEIPFGPETMDALRRHRFSGNVRELRNVVEAALAIGELRLEDTRRGHRDPGEAEPLPPYKEARTRTLRDFERSYLGRLIRECEGNASEAARRAGMDRQYLLSLLRRHDLR